MKKMKLEVELNEKQKAARAERIRLLLQNGDVQNFLSRYHLDPSILETQSSRLDRYARNTQICRSCKGMQICRMKVPVQSALMEVDEEGMLVEYYGPCRYQNQKTAKLAHRSNFTVSHLQDDDYLVTLEKLEETMDREPQHYINAYTSALRSFNAPTGCLFFGQPGTGKSTMMMALANQYAQNGKKVVFVRVPLLMSELKDNLSDEEWRRTILGRMRFADVLFLDDFGSESVTQWTRDEILFPVLDERMNAKRKTYFASNISPQELEERYAVSNAGEYTLVAAKRLMERVNTLARPVQLMGSSRRPTGGTL